MHLLLPQFMDDENAKERELECTLIMWCLANVMNCGFRKYYSDEWNMKYMLLKNATKN
jgi:hypothetical protein